MSLFYLLVTILFIATAIFYIVFFSLIYYWHLKKTSYVIVPVIFTFEFFITGFLIVAIISILVKYLPYIINII